MKTTEPNFFLIVTCLTTLALLVIISVHYITYQDLVEPEPGQSLTEISWPETRRLLAEGKITSVAQAHGDWWWLYRIDGEPFKTRQPSTEAVYNAVDQCGDVVCATIDLHFPVVGKQAASEISWPDVIALVNQGLVTELMQSHENVVVITLKNTDTYSTVAPKVDAILEVVDSCKDPACRDIFILFE